jgi:hypothetical protein
MTAQLGSEPSNAGTQPEQVDAAEPAAPPPGKASAWTGLASRPAAQGAVAFAAYLLLWIAGWALPLVAHARAMQLDQSSMDPNFYVWSLRWWPYALAHGLNPLYSRQVGAPTGFNLAWTATVPPLALLASPLTLLLGPVGSFNLLTLLAPPASAWAAFLACRRLTRRFWAALIGGACYGFSAYEMNHTAAGQLNLIWNLLLPLMVYLALLWRDGKLSRPWFVGLMGLLLLTQLLLFLETFFELTVLLVIALPVGYALAGQPGRVHVAALARLLAVAYGAALVVASPYLAYALAHYPQGLTRSPASFGLNLASVVIPRAGQTLGAGWLATLSKALPGPSDAGYVGIPALLIVAAVAVWMWSSRLGRFLVVMFAVVLALAIGPVLVIGTTRVGSVPWSRLWLLPLARSALPNRFTLFGGLLLALIVAVWLAAPTRARLLQWGKWLLAGLAIAAILADAPAIVAAQPAANTRIPAFFAAGEYRHFIRPGQTVVVISTRGNAGMLFQADTGFYMRLAGGFVNMAITPRSDLPAEVQDLAHATPALEGSLTAYLRSAHISDILVEQGSEPRWVGVLTKLDLRSKTIGGMLIYQVRQ